MLYILYGSDFQKRNTKLNQLLLGLEKKRPNAELFKLDEMDISPVRLEELAGSQGLFDSKYIVQIDQVMDIADARETVLESAKSLGESENVFIIVENELSKAVLKRLEKHAERVEEFSKKKEGKKEFNTFALADALGKRDRKALWVEYQKNCRELKAPEEIHGVLFWQLKSIAIAQQTNSAEEAGMKAFPYSKAKGFGKNYTDKELYDLLGDLVERYHLARRGEGDMSTQLEQFVLTV
ncbi:MAG: hypothetical protein WDZ82_03255 [Candidatus Paceibacterota bacterium]